MNTALPTFTAHLANASDLLALIQNHVEDHLGVAPDEVTWANAGDAGRLLASLEEIAAIFGLTQASCTAAAELRQPACRG